MNLIEFKLLIKIKVSKVKNSAGARLENNGLEASCVIDKNIHSKRIIMDADIKTNIKKYRDNSFRINIQNTKTKNSVSIDEIV